MAFLEVRVYETRVKQRRGDPGQHEGWGVPHSYRPFRKCNGRALREVGYLPGCYPRLKTSYPEPFIKSWDNAPTALRGGHIDPTPPQNRSLQCLILTRFFALYIGIFSCNLAYSYKISRRRGW